MEPQQGQMLLDGIDLRSLGASANLSVVLPVVAVVALAVLFAAGSHGSESAAVRFGCDLLRARLSY